MKIKLPKFKEEKEMIFEEIINSFFQGSESFDTRLGNVWVAKHGYKRIKRSDLYKIQAEMQKIGIEAPHLTNIDRENPDFGYIPEFETLTIEPKEGGQYEVAVRIWSENKWRGYKIHNFNPLECFLIGVNTRGH